MLIILKDKTKKAHARNEENKHTCIELNNEIEQCQHKGIIGILYSNGSKDSNS